MSLEQLQRALDCPAELSPPAAHVLLVLAWYADPEGRRTWPSVATLARQTHQARATVQRALRELQAAALLVPIERSSGRLPTVYSLSLPTPQPPQTEAPHSDARLTARQGEGPHTVAKGPHSEREGPHSEAQSVMNRHEPKSAGARATPTGARPGADPERMGPPANLHDSSPRFPLPSAPEKAAPVAPGNGVARPVLDDATREEIIARRRREAAALAAASNAEKA